MSRLEAIKRKRFMSTKITGSEVAEGMNKGFPRMEIDHPEMRGSLICDGCGKEKDEGLILCWQCYKYRQDITPFKDFHGSVEEWLDYAVPRQDILTDAPLHTWSRWNPAKKDFVVVDSSNSLPELMRRNGAKRPEHGPESMCPVDECRACDQVSQSIHDIHDI